MALLHFDATQVAPSTGAADAIPAGWYNAAIDASEMKPTRDGLGAYLELAFKVLDGQYAGRKVFTRLNLRNQNAQAQEIAMKDLSAIAHATGVLQVADSTQLHNIPIKIKVKVRPADGQYEAGNEISAYRNINDQTVGNAAPAAAAAPAFGAPPAPAPMAPPAGTGWAPPAAAAQQPWAAPAAAAAPAPMAAPAQAPAAPPAPPAWGAPPVQAAPAAAAAAPAAAAPVAPPWAQQPAQ